MDEEFTNYIQMADWMRSFIDDDDWRNLVKDIKLHILSGNKKTLLSFTCKSAFPTSLGEIMFDSSVTDVTQIVFNVEFRFEYMTWEKITL